MIKVGSVEFGNWIINALMKEKLLSKPASKSAVETSKVRVSRLKSAENLLPEFLLHPEEMMRRAPG